MAEVGKRGLILEANTAKGIPEGHDHHDRSGS